MNTNIHSIQPLVACWEQYVTECVSVSQTPDLSQFAGWLLHHQTLPDATKREVSFEPTESVQIAEPEQLRLLDKIGILIWRLSRFMRLSFKHHFEGHSLQSIDEFSLMAGAYHMKEPTKTQLFQYDLLETTTGLQMLARLMKQGLAYENPDPTDRRQKRVVLTPEGQQVYQQAAIQMDKISDDLFHILSHEELEQLAGVLTRLDRYNTERA